MSCRIAESFLAIVPPADYHPIVDSYCAHRHITRSQRKPRLDQGLSHPNLVSFNFRYRPFASCPLGQQYGLPFGSKCGRIIANTLQPDKRGSYIKENAEPGDSAFAVETGRGTALMHLSQGVAGPLNVAKMDYKSTSC